MHLTMANLTGPYILFDYEAREGQQESSLDTKLTTIKPIYSVAELVKFVLFALFWLGFVSSLPILVIFFKRVFNFSLSIGFFSLALADLSLCVVYLTDFIVFNWFYSWYYWKVCKFKKYTREISAWTTAVICWEQLYSIILPEKVGSKYESKAYLSYFIKKFPIIHQV